MICYDDLTGMEHAFFTRYVDAGYSRRRVFRMVEEKRVREYIKQHPGEVEEVRTRVEHAEKIETEKREERERLRRLEHFKFEHGLVVTGVPDVDFSGVEGMIAFRTWGVWSVNQRVNVEGDRVAGMFLRSTVMNTSWKSIMIADKIPTESNSSGLYCIKLDPLGLMTRAAGYFGDVCGLLELRGRVLEHTDGVVRAEWARIICVFVQANEKTESIYTGLCQSYPTVSMYVLHREQIAEILLRVTVLQSMRERSIKI